MFYDVPTFSHEFPSSKPGAAGLGTSAALGAARGSGAAACRFFGVDRGVEVSKMWG